MNYNIVTRGFKERIVQPEKTSVSRQWLCKHVSTATNSRDRSNRYTSVNREIVGSVSVLYTGVGSESDLSYLYDHITKLCRQRAEVIKNHETEHVRNIGLDEATHRKYNRLKLSSGQAYDRSSD
jgi:hypothetical protein